MWSGTGEAKSGGKRVTGLTRVKGHDGPNPTCLRPVREVAMVAPIFDRNRDVIQLRLGGVPLNFLTAGQLGELTISLARHLNFSKSKNRKFSVEIDRVRRACRRH